jgi:predicted dehydrogenase
MNEKNNTTRRDFIKKASLGAGALSIGAMGFSAKSYASILGANDRLNIAIAGLGRRLGAFTHPIGFKGSNVKLLYLCDVMKSQRERAAQTFSKIIDYTPKLENDFFKVLEDKNVDAIINAMPDHWHAPGAWLAMEAGKHTYVEKPLTHNPYEGELLIDFQKKYNKILQMGNQQRSSGNTIEVIKAIHNGIIGKPYKAIAYYNNKRGVVPISKAAPAPEGLDWELWQGPAPRKAYTHDTWNYNWHWYGWDYSTGETGNNAAHELDVARWALGVDFPSKVMVDAGKYHFVDDGWVMYDTMDATFQFEGNKTIRWDGRSRNGVDIYGGTGRGTIIFGDEGSVFVDRGHYKVFDREGKELKSIRGNSDESGTQLGGGGGVSTQHVVNFFDAVRGKTVANSPVDEGHKSTLLCHLANIGSRTGEILECNPKKRPYNQQ